jgi:hypothetical protein
MRRWVVVVAVVVIALALAYALFLAPRDDLLSASIRGVRLDARCTLRQ